MADHRASDPALHRLQGHALRLPIEIGLGLACVLVASLTPVPVRAVAALIGGLAIPVHVLMVPLRRLRWTVEGALGASILLIAAYWSLGMFFGLLLHMPLSRASSGCLAAGLLAGVFLLALVTQDSPVEGAEAFDDEVRHPEHAGN